MTLLVSTGKHLNSNYTDKEQNGIVEVKGHYGSEKIL